MTPSNSFQIFTYSILKDCRVHFYLLSLSLSLSLSVPNLIRLSILYVTYIVYIVSVYDTNICIYIHSTYIYGFICKYSTSAAESMKLQPLLVKLFLKSTSAASPFCKLGLRSVFAT